MRNYDLKRGKMVEELHLTKGISDERVLAAMNRIPRHLFVEEALHDMAYQLSALPIACSQSLSHPFTVAHMTELLKLKGTERVLEIGTGSGYQTAVLAELCEKVFSVERLRNLVVKARRFLEALGYYNILIKLGDGSHGWAEKSPFDAIIVTAKVKTIPKHLEQQLAEGGRMVIPVMDGQQQMLLLQHKINGRLETINRYPCDFIKLVGECGWAESDERRSVLV